MSLIDSNFRDTAWVMSWFQSITYSVRRKPGGSRKPKKVTPNQIEWNKPKKGHIKSTPMGQRPNHNRIIESWADSNQYSRFVLVVSRFESKFWKAFRFVSWFESKPWKGFWVVSRLESKFWKTIWVMSHLNWLPENHFESWVDLNQFLKALWVMSWVRIKTFWDWVESNRKNESYPCLLSADMRVFSTCRPESTLCMCV